MNLAEESELNSLIDTAWQGLLKAQFKLNAYKETQQFHNTQEEKMGG